MGVFKHFQQLWKGKNSEDVKMWRKHPVIVRIEKPTKIHRARALGYKAKQGFVVIRVRIKKGGRRREKPSGGRKPKKSGLLHFTPSQRKQTIAEKRANKKYPNLEVLNSYKVGEDGQYHYFEVIMVDPNHPIIKKEMKWITSQRGRVFRGLTSSAKKSRGL